MKLNKLRDMAYYNAASHGWYENQYSDSHWLMMVITEISEAIQADRKGEHAKVNMFKEWQGNSIPFSEETRVDRFNIDFEYYIKDSVEDEMADILIRLLSLAGYKKIDIKNYNVEVDTCTLFTEHCFKLVSYITSHNTVETIINWAVSYILRWAMQENIDIMWFVYKKMEYNKYRRYKHAGLKY